jgi:hypothetical protein
MAHLGGLPHPVTSDVHEYASGLRDTTSHPTCTHTLPLLSSPHSEIERLGSRFPNSEEPSIIVVTVGPEADLKSMSPSGAVTSKRLRTYFPFTSATMKLMRTGSGGRRHGGNASYVDGM